MSAGFALLKAKLLLVFLICVHQIMKGLPLSGVQNAIPEKNVQRGGSWANVGFLCLPGEEEMVLLNKGHKYLVFASALHLLANHR